MTWRPGGVHGGVVREWKGDGEGNLVIRHSQDVAPLLDRNKAMATHNDGYSPSRELRRVASIPVILQMEWIEKYGFNPVYAADKSVLKRLLNDPDYAYLRTAEGRIGMSNGVMR